MGEEDEESHREGVTAGARVRSGWADGIINFRGGRLSPGDHRNPGIAMKLATALAAIAAAAPFAALAQVVYPAPPAVVYDMPRDLYQDCAARQDALAQRRANLEQTRVALDRENDRLTRQSQRLADELRLLDNRDVSAVNRYNARQQAYTERVADHNQRAAQMNQEAADTNADIQFMLNDCVPRGFVWRDRDWWERDRMYWTPGYWDRYRLR
jgi:Skp family chaperone for outer membrane proteins